MLSSHAGIRTLLLPVAAFFTIFIAPSLPAQEASYVQPAPATLRIGIDAGILLSWQQGSYTPFGRIPFSTGKGTGFSAGAAFEYPLDREPNGFSLELSAGYQSQHITGTVESTDPQTVIIQSLGSSGFDTVLVPVDFRKTATSDFNYAAIQLTARRNFVAGLYCGIGAEAGVRLNAGTQRTTTILSRTVEIPNHGLQEVFYSESTSPDPYTLAAPARERTDVNPLALRGIIYLGYEFTWDQMSIGPRIAYALPLNAVIDPEMKLHALAITLGLRYTLGQ